MIQLIAECMAFHSEFPKTKIEVQDVNSPLSFNQTLISSRPWTRKWVKNTRNQMAHEMMLYTRLIWRKSTGQFFRHEELNLKRRIWAWLLDERVHRDWRSQSRIRWSNSHFCVMIVWSWIKGQDAISSHEEENAELRSSVGCWSNACDMSKDPPITSDLSRYNSRD